MVANIQAFSHAQYLAEFLVGYGYTTAEAVSKLPLTVYNHE